MKKLNRQQIMNITVTAVMMLLFVILIAIPMRISILRFASATKDAGIEFANAFVGLVNKNKLIPSTLDKIPDYKKYLFKKDNKGNELNNKVEKENKDQLKKDNAKYWNNFKEKKNIFEYTLRWLLVLTYILQATMILAVFFLALKLLLKRYFKRQKVAPNEKTKQLQTYIIFEKTILERIKQAIKGYLEFVVATKWLRVVYILMFLLASNAATIIFEAVAVYFYILRTMDFKLFPYQIYKLLYDLKIYFKLVPVTAHIILAVIIFNAVRKKIALRRLRIYENRNAELVEALPICSMLVGTMGTKKTTILTDMALTQTNNFKNQALEDLLKLRKYFPKFNFSKLDEFLKICIIHHQIYSLKSIDRIFDKKLARCIKHEQLSMFGESLADYADWSDGLSLAEVIETFRTYSKLFLVYYLNSALIYSNYSIRYDYGYSDLGNFPLYYCDYFSTPPYDAMTDEASTYAHILDFDFLRLGKKIIEDNKLSNVFDFGFFAITEIGKERGNQLTTQGMKRTDEETNQKNDYFNAFIKLIRHTSTINHYPYSKILVDEQRPESLEADMRELFDIISIKKSDEYKCTFPVYFERSFIEYFVSLYDRYNLDRIYYRSNDSLKYYLARKLISWIYGINERILNKYGLYKCRLEISHGMLDEKTEHKYYLMLKKIYSNRFKTDAYQAFFDASRSEEIGIGDINRYESTRATIAELQAQNSYFIRDLSKYNHLGENR